MTAPKSGPRPGDTVEESFYRGFAAGWRDRSEVADRIDAQARIEAYLAGWRDGAAAAGAGGTTAKSQAVVR